MRLLLCLIELVACCTSVFLPHKLFCGFAVHVIENADEVIYNTIVNRGEKINQGLSVAKGRVPAISLSVGIAHGDEDDTTDTLFKKADKVLYKVKATGKSGVIYEK